MKNLTGTSKKARAERAARLKAAVMELLKCTEEQFGEHQYASGLTYLRNYIPGDSIAIDALSRSRVFWNWWKNHWTNRDESFIEKLKHPRLTVAMRVKLYTTHHDGKALAGCIYPNGIVLDESYAVMIEEVIKTETQPA